MGVFRSSLLNLYEVTNVIQRFERLDIKAGIGWHIELLAALVSRPGLFALDADAAFACIQFHDFCCAGIKNQTGWKNHAYGFFAAVGEQNRV